MPRTILPGKPYPQGATWDGSGVNFSIYSEDAKAVNLCLFEDPRGAECETIALRESTGRIWHCYIHGVRPGQYYGFRIDGPYEPENGLRFNPAKLLIDPYAKALAGNVDWNAPVFGYEIGNPDEDLKRDDGDDAAAVPKGVVTVPAFDWENDRPPLTPLHDSIIYEVHVKGFTARHPEIPEDIRGTYAGLTHPLIVE
jgi:isoamylase